MTKRTMDFVSALMLLVVLSPLMIVIAATILSTMGRPVFYRQVRPGRDGAPFELTKFRSMREGAGSDAHRLTRFGRLLRMTSLDELPELINVIRGDMSLVGPRPLLMEYLSLYTDEQMRRHEVRPGITGWAQVNGRNELSWEDKFTLDVWYVDHQSVSVDLKILWMTLKKVVTAEGINQAGSATAERFRGSEQ